MKKLALALMCLVSVAFFASCQKPVENPEPSIAVMTGENFITGTAENPTIIDITDENALNLKYGFHVEANAQTKKELSTLKLTCTTIDATGTDTFDTIIDLSGKTSYDFSEYLFPQDERDIYLEATITALVTDADSKTNTATIAFKLDLPAQPLEVNDITWVRDGSNVVADTKEEMERLGLKWTSSYKEVYATIEPLNGATMYICDGDDFDKITTDLEKSVYFANLVENGVSVTSYRKITTNNSADYNDMLAVIDAEGNLNLVLFKHADIEYIPGVKTIITITGKTK